MISALIARYMSYKNFFMGFNIFSIFINIMALSMLYLHFFSEKKLNLGMILLFISANFLYMPSIISVICGETSLLLNSLVIFSYLSLKKNRDIQAGFFLALAINIKLFLVVFFLLFFATKKYRALISFGLFSVIIGIVPLFFYDINIYKNFYIVLHHIEWYGMNWNSSLYGFFARLFGDRNQHASSIWHMPILGKQLYNIISIMYVCIIFYFAKKNNHLNQLFAFTLSSMLLLSPLGWNYYFPLLITAMMITIKHAKMHRYYISIMCLLFLSIMISGYPLALNRNPHISTQDILLKSNLFFFALILFTTANSLPLLFSPQQNYSGILSRQQSIKIWVLSLFPSFIGIISIILAIYTHKEFVASSIATVEDTYLLPTKRIS